MLFLAIEAAVVAIAVCADKMRFAEGTMLSALFFAGMYCGSAFVQLGHEFATVGHPTLLYDYCSTFIWLLGVPLLTVGLLLPAGFYALVMQGSAPPRWAMCAAGALRFAWGAAFGAGHWTDWQVQQPCM